MSTTGPPDDGGARLGAVPGSGHGRCPGRHGDHRPTTAGIATTAGADAGSAIDPATTADAPATDTDWGRFVQSQGADRVEQPDLGQRAVLRGQQLGDGRGVERAVGPTSTQRPDHHRSHGRDQVTGHGATHLRRRCDLAQHVVAIIAEHGVEQPVELAVGVGVDHRLAVGCAVGVGRVPVAIDVFDGGDEAGRVEDRRAVVAVEERGDDGRAVIEPGPGGQTGNDGRNDPTCGRGHMGSIAAKVFGQPFEAFMLVEQTENRLVEGRHVSVPTFHV